MSTIHSRAARATPIADLVARARAAFEDLTRGVSDGREAEARLAALYEAAEVAEINGDPEAAEVLRLAHEASAFAWPVVFEARPVHGAPMHYGARA